MFGRNSEAGKALFSLYKSHEAPKINYPKPKQKTKEQIDAEKQPKTQDKKCPQMTQIEYPEPQRKESYKIHAVDLIPKRKN